MEKRIAAYTSYHYGKNKIVRKLLMGMVHHTEVFPTACDAIQLESIVAVCKALKQDFLAYATYSCRPVGRRQLYFLINYENESGIENCDTSRVM